MQELGVGIVDSIVYLYLVQCVHLHAVIKEKPQLSRKQNKRSLRFVYNLLAMRMTAIRTLLAVHESKERIGLTGLLM